MSHDERDQMLALESAFSGVYLDLCTHGVCRYDPTILATLWAEFVGDMRAGFPSLFASIGPTPH